MNWRLLFCLSFLCALASAATAGPQPDSLQRDTVTEGHIRIIEPGISTHHPTLLFPPSLAREHFLVLPLFTTSAFNPEMPPPFLATGSAGKLDLLLPLREQIAGQSGLQTITVMLGTAEMAGTAYIMYKHLKKYGLFK